MSRFSHRSPRLTKAEREERRAKALEAVAAIVAANVASESIYLKYRGASANDVAHWMGLKGARRLGNGAVKGSWTGFMSPALRIAPTLEALARAGELEQGREFGGHRAEYWPKDGRR